MSSMAEPKQRAGSGIPMAILGGSGGAVVGAIVFGFLGWLVADASLANPQPCNEKLCGLGEALAAVFLFIVIAVPGAYGTMLTGCWLALDRSGYAHAGSTVRWLALIVPITMIATRYIFPDSLDAVWLGINMLGTPALARWIAVKRGERVLASSS